MNTNSNTNTPHRDSNGADSPPSDAGGTNNNPTPAVAAAAATTGGINSDSVPGNNPAQEHAPSDSPKNTSWLAHRNNKLLLLMWAVIVVASIAVALGVTLSPSPSESQVHTPTRTGEQFQDIFGSQVPTPKPTRTGEQFQDTTEKLVMNIDGIPVGTTEFSSNDYDAEYLYVVSLTGDSVKGSLNGSFKQQSDVVTVGTFSRFEGNDAIFENGSYCGAISAPSSGTVQFIEDCDAAELTVQSVTEPSTCVFKMVVSGLCGENDTPNAHGSPLLFLDNGNDSDSTWYSVGFKPGGVFKQTNEYLVGLVTETDDFEVTFEDGSYCDDISAPRSGTVQFIEDCAAEELTVTVTEPDTCFYKMEVNGVCAGGDEDE